MNAKNQPFPTPMAEFVRIFKNPLPPYARTVFLDGTLAEKSPEIFPEHKEYFFISERFSLKSGA